MLIVATCLWDANDASFAWSRCYDESWVERLYRGFRRNLSVPFRFIAFTDRPRRFSEAAIEQEAILRSPPDCGALVEPYRLDMPMILVGLDTIVVGNLDHIAARALAGAPLALTRDPFFPERACTGVAVAPAGCASVWRAYDGEPNDMVHLRKQEHVFLDDEFPGQFLSYKVHIRDRVLVAPPASTRIVYFHGAPKAADIAHLDWVWEHWS